METQKKRLYNRKTNMGSASTGELYYLRMMLTVVQGPTCHEDIRTVKGTQYDSYRDAYFASGFLGDNKEYIEAIKEAHKWGSGVFLKKLFVTLLLATTMDRPRHVWNKTNHWLADGILYNQRRLANDKALELTEEEIDNLTLLEIEKSLQANSKSFKDFPTMQYPNGYVTETLGNRLMYDEKDYNAAEQLIEFNKLYASLTDELKAIYEKIIDAVNRQQGGVFFLHGYGGNGKTFMWRTLASALRAQKKIVLTVATSEIAFLLLSGGRTAHSKFKIPVPTLENSTCNIDHKDELAAIQIKYLEAKLWFLEVTLDKYYLLCQEEVDRISFTLQLMLSKIWDECEVLTLTKNMRLQSSTNSAHNSEITEFSEWLLKVGEGKLSEPNNGYADIDITDELLITDYEDPIKAIVESTYPDLLQNYQHPDFFISGAILASTIEIVDQINNYVLNLLPGETAEYSSTIDRTEAAHSEAFDVVTTEFLSSLRCSGVPNHKIVLKVGTPIMLLRNFDQSEGICNGTRLTVTKLGEHVLEAKIIYGKNIGAIIYIPRMEMSPSESPWPFKLIRRQFPIIVSFAMTINKSQGQSLDSVGLYLPRSVFSHGQL
ncbi:helicase-like protein [Trifolium medium]|uniref:ATP-dependent DNA helicase n=1 Tax=Trifolium medium TaxID=97028 RepID=A0A392LWF4_9FABA|nr:helicase-like protein [Trifolium medium]